MHRIAIVAASAGVLTAAAIGLTGFASAAPTGGSNAADAVNELQAQGFSVQINGDQGSPLSECSVTGISGLSGTNSKGQAYVQKGSTVYVGVDCDDDHDG